MEKLSISKIWRTSTNLITVCVDEFKEEYKVKKEKLEEQSEQLENREEDEPPNQGEIHIEVPISSPNNNYIIGILSAPLQNFNDGSSSNSVGSFHADRGDRYNWCVNRDQGRNSWRKNRGRAISRLCGKCGRDRGSTSSYYHQTCWVYNFGQTHSVRNRPRNGERKNNYYYQ